MKHKISKILNDENFKLVEKDILYVCLYMLYWLQQQ